MSVSEREEGRGDNGSAWKRLTRSDFANRRHVRVNEGERVRPRIDAGVWAVLMHTQYSGALCHGCALGGLTRSSRERLELFLLQSWQLGTKDTNKGSDSKLFSFLSFSFLAKTQTEVL